MAAEAEAAREARAKVRKTYIYISMVTGVELYNEAYIQMKTFSHLIIHLDEGGWDELIKTFKSSSHIEKCPMIMNCVNRMKSMLGDCLPFLRYTQR